MTIFNPPKFVTRSLIGTVGLSAIAFSGMTESVKAANFQGSFSVPGVPVQTVVFDKYDANGNDIETGTFTTEMEDISFNLQIPDLGTVMVREDPNKVSSGKTTVNDTGDGNFQIEDSYFDIYTQLSLDGGTTWLDSVDANGNSAPMRVELAQAPNPSSNQFGCISSNHFLPPDCGGYWSQFHSWFWIIDPQTNNLIATIHLSNVFHFGFSNVNRVALPNLDQREIFISEVQVDVEVEMVPEPLTILGSFTALGFGTFFKRKVGKKAQQDKA